MSPCLPSNSSSVPSVHSHPSPQYPQIPPIPAAPKLLHFHNIAAQPHHSTPDCPLLPTYLSSIRLPSSQKPAPATPGLFLVCQLPGDAQCAKHPARHHPRSPRRKRRGIKQNTALSVITKHYYTVLQEKQRKKNPNHKSKPHHLYPSLKLAEFMAYKSFKITQTTNSSTESLFLEQRFKYLIPLSGGRELKALLDSQSMLAPFNVSKEVH